MAIRRGRRLDGGDLLRLLLIVVVLAVPGAFVAATTGAGDVVGRWVRDGLGTAAAPGSVVIPEGIPVNASGDVAVVCQDGPGGPGYYFPARPGDVVVCDNGAVPRWSP